MKLEKKDIQFIADENCFNEICFDKWIAFEHRRVISTPEMYVSYHYDIIACLENLQKEYEDGQSGTISVKNSLKDIISVAHYQARNLYAKSERQAGMMEDAMWAYDIFYLLRDTQKYLKSKLSWETTINLY